MPVLDYFKLDRAKKRGPSADNKPILNDEDQQFLERITSEASPPPLPERPTVILDNGEKVKGKDAQIALMDGAQNIPLPQSPPANAETPVEGEEPKANEIEKKKHGYWSYVPAIPQIRLSRDKKQAADDLKAAAEAVRSGQSGQIPDDGKIDTAEERKEEQDLTSVLDQLNLSAVNNRVFSFSKESQEILEKFKQVLKDIVNGVPTAYDDLEKLIKEKEHQLDRMFSSMPPFLQTLVKSLPAKMASTLAPELVAATSEKPGADAAHLSDDHLGTKHHRKSKKNKVPSLKRLVSEQGAVASMLRSILNFLKLRFPAFMTGTNILMSLAVFVLLFVFWYCHKRGRETRLAAESAAASAETSDVEKSASDLEDSVAFDNVRTEDTEPPIQIRSDSIAGDKPSAAVEDMAKVLDLPEPVKVPLPEQADEGLMSPEAQKK